MSLIHEIKASYVSNVVVKRCEEREKKDLERNFEHSVEKKKSFLSFLCGKDSLVGRVLV